MKDIVERLMDDWLAWGAPHNAEEAVNETAMAMRCREAASEITRLRAELLAARDDIRYLADECACARRTYPRRKGR